MGLGVMVFAAGGDFAALALALARGVLLHAISISPRRHGLPPSWPFWQADRRHHRDGTLQYAQIRQGFVFTWTRSASSSLDLVAADQPDHQHLHALDTCRTGDPARAS